MLESLIERLGLRNLSYALQDMVDEFRRINRTYKLKEYCLEKQLRYYPEPVDRFPPFAAEVEDYIWKKARKDLPTCQFRGTNNLVDIAESYEIAGDLGYNSKLFEIAYHGNVKSKITKWTRGKFLHVAISGKFKMEGKIFRDADSVILWHSHPDGYGELSTPDITYNKAFFNYLSSKKVYMVIFLPVNSSCYWYEIKKNPKPKKPISSLQASMPYHCISCT